MEVEEGLRTKTRAKLENPLIVKRGSASRKDTKSCTISREPIFLIQLDNCKDRMIVSNP